MRSTAIVTPIDTPTHEFLTRLAEHKDIALTKLIRQWVWKGISDFATNDPKGFNKLNLADLQLNAMAQVPKPGRPKRVTLA